MPTNAYGIRYPASTDDPNVPRDMKNLADDAGAKTQALDAAWIATGQVPVSHGGTGLASATLGSFLQGNGTSAMILRTPSQVLSDIGAAATAHTHTMAQVASGNLAANRVALGSGSTPGTLDNNVYLSGTNLTVSSDGNLNLTANGSIRLVAGGGEVDISTSGNVTAPQTYAQTSSSSANMIVLSSGLYGRATSVRRIKANIEDLDDSKFDFSKLRPRTWHPKENLEAAGLDPNHADDDQARKAGVRRIAGFIAEEVAKVAPILVPLDADGKPDGLDYDRITALLVAEVQKQTKRADELEARIAKLEKAAS